MGGRSHPAHSAADVLTSRSSGEYLQREVNRWRDKVTVLDTSSDSIE
jgi:hypothetical protein